MVRSNIILEFLTYLLSTSEANSRFVFLLQGLATSIAVMIIAVQFVRSSPTTEGFVMMTATLLGGGAAIQAGRALSKKAGKGNVTKD